MYLFTTCIDIVAYGTYVLYEDQMILLHQLQQWWLSRLIVCMGMPLQCLPQHQMPWQSNNVTIANLQQHDGLWNAQVS